MGFSQYLPNCGTKRLSCHFSFRTAVCEHVSSSVSLTITGMIGIFNFINSKYSVNNDDNLCTYLFAIYISSLRKCLLNRFAQFFYWTACFLSIEFWAFFFCSGYKLFIRCLFYKYFAPVYCWSFYSQNGIF